jgi:type II secretory pathway component GspD/PulD (secretin)
MEHKTKPGFVRGSPATESIFSGSMMLNKSKDTSIRTLINLLAQSNMITLETSIHRVQKLLYTHFKKEVSYEQIYELKEEDLLERFVEEEKRKTYER